MKFSIVNDVLKDPVALVLILVVIILLGLIVIRSQKEPYTTNQYNSSPYPFQDDSYGMDCYDNGCMKSNKTSDLQRPHDPTFASVGPDQMLLPKDQKMPPPPKPSSLPKQPEPKTDPKIHDPKRSDPIDQNSFRNVKSVDNKPPEDEFPDEAFPNSVPLKHVQMPS